MCKITLSLIEGMKGTEVRGKVENPRKQRSSGVFTASDGESVLLHSAFPVCNSDLELHNPPCMKQALQYHSVQNLSF